MSTSKWYQKKRYIIPLILVLLFVVIGVASPSQKKDVPTVDSQSAAKKETKAETKTKFKIGEAYNKSNQSITAVSAERNINCGYSPDSSQEFVKVNLELDNKSDKTMSYNSFSWKIMSGEGDITNPAYCQNEESKAGKLKSGELAVNANKKAFLVFSVPKNSTPLVAVYEANLFNKESIQFELQ
jgi:hypothetical protein